MAGVSLECWFLLSLLNGETGYSGEEGGPSNLCSSSATADGVSRHSRSIRKQKWVPFHQRLVRESPPRMTGEELKIPLE